MSATTTPDIHPMSAIHPDAQIGTGTTVGAFTSIAADVVIGENTWIGPNVSIMDGARIGSNCRIFPGAVISAIPQDLKYDGEQTTAEIGVTIAGFSSLATLILFAPGQTRLHLDTYRFEGMLINSLLVILFSLLPLLISSLGASNLTTWRISSLILLIVFGTRGCLVTANTLRFRQSGHRIGAPFYIMTTLLVAVVGVLAVNVTGSIHHLAGGLYLFGLFGVLANACVLFLLVFLGALERAQMP